MPQVSRPSSRHKSRLFAVERGSGHTHLRIEARLGVLFGVLAAAVTIWSAAATGYVVFRDEVLTALVGRQRDMQYAYEDRIASLRASIDRLTSRQLIDQDSFEGKVQDLIARQALLETRQAIVQAMASQVETMPRVAPATPPAPQTPRLTAQNVVPLAGSARQSEPISPGLSAFAPVEAKPRPAAEPIPLRGSAPAPVLAPAPAPASTSAETPRPARTSMAEPDQARGITAGERLGAMDAAARRLETSQATALAAIEARAGAAHSRYMAVIGDLGISRARLDRLDQPPAQGGPLVPVEPGAGPFEATVHRLQLRLAETARLRRVVEALPLRRPLKGEFDTTSGFGYRVDPFTRGMAMHTGIDFRDDYGAAVRATAAGKVVSAEWNGGYGNMVEVDHGFGLSTRYAHLSAISVSEGQRVEAGAVLGRLGSTGRSTGPHLHYETRVDGEPVDPLRYLRAGARLTPG